MKPVFLCTSWGNHWISFGEGKALWIPKKTLPGTPSLMPTPPGFSIQVRRATVKLFNGEGAG